jgi:hypothetical protein
MTNHPKAMNRRGFLKLGVAAMYFALPGRLRSDSALQLEGVFPILHAPVRDRGQSPFDP